jgi:hypothetical protein
MSGISGLYFQESPDRLFAAAPAPAIQVQAVSMQLPPEGAALSGC